MDELLYQFRRTPPRSLGTYFALGAVVLIGGSLGISLGYGAEGTPTALRTTPGRASPLAGAEQSSNPPSQLVLRQCLVSLIQEVQVPAQAAGVLVEITVQEGLAVTAGQLLARIDDSQPMSDHQVATLKLQAAQEKAKNDISVRYAQAAAEVARIEYEQAWRANQKNPGTISETEVRRLYLAHQRAALGVEQALLDQRLANLEAKVLEAQAAAASFEVQRRRLVSPLDGVVVKIFKRPGEWVQPGDPVVHLVRMDRLRVEGMVPAVDQRDRDGRLLARGYSPAEIDRCPVSVHVEFPGGRRETFTGQVVFVSPLVQAGGQYRFWAEVENRKQADHWLLLPGLLADVTVHLQPAKKTP
ncbi:MAG: HlyD family efflux transporter periplasmic adaptor subunit [Thermoguttaceae bacterium]|nr:HlyD family efflux transporter periplasmic adaptor subunit [Thermoguttaceae bacterium]MDW8037732.1 HlyD family efflux transporter periplasmic adaptor subunit [Thermoguttaceae bacterium]